jgi:hypothetical protein
MGLGALLAFIVQLKFDLKIKNMKWLRELGLILIIFPVFFYDESTPFPSYFALAPVLGACLILLARDTSGIAYKFLTNKMIVYIGVISYSLYLWHWPIIVFNNWYFSNLDEVIRGLFSIILSFIVAIISYHYIEMPYRNKKRFSDKKIIKYFFLVYPSLIAFCLVFLIYGNSSIVDSTGGIKKVHSRATEKEPTRNLCTDKIRNMGKFELCSLSKKSTSTNGKIFVWGDSHASAMIPAFEQISQSMVVNFSVTTGCPPILRINRTDSFQNCQIVNDMVFGHIIANDYDTIFLVAAFNNYLNKGIIGQDNANFTRSPEKAKEAFSVEFESTISKLKAYDLNIVIVSQPPVFNKDVPLDYLQQSIIKSDFEIQTINRAEYELQKAVFFETVPLTIKGSILDLTNLFCDNNKCYSSSKNGDLLFKDKHHVSNFQAREIGKYITKYINRK